MPRKPKTEESDKKTANGLGSIDELPSGLWRWRVSVRTPNGKRTRLSGTCKTETLALKALNKAVTDNERGLLSAPDRTTVAEFAEIWLKRQEGLRKRSSHTYRHELSYALEHIGKMKVRDVRAPHLKTLLGTLATRPMGKRGADGKPPEDAKPMHPRTLGKVLTHLRAVFREAVSDQVIYVNPCDGVRKPKSAPLEVVGQVLDFDQKARLHEIGEALYAAGVCALWPAVFTCLSVGLRRSEVMGLRWKDVDLENAVLSIRHTSTWQGDGTFEVSESTKTKASRREIDMPPSLVAMLKSHQTQQALERAKAGSAWRGSDAVFATALGWWVSPDNLGRTLNNILEWSDSKALLEQYKPESTPTRTAKKGENLTNLERRIRAVPVPHRARLEAIVRDGGKLPDIRVHDLRHTYATLALRSKVPPAVVSKTLGHARISITLDIYRHVLPSEMKENVFDLFAAPLPVRDLPVIAVN